MSQDSFANLFRLQLTPPPRTLYRGPRHESVGNKSPDQVPFGKYVYMPVKTRSCYESVEAVPDVLKDLLHRHISRAVATSDLFFDVNEYGLFASVAGDLPYKEEVFSIARSFQLQVLFDDQGYYLSALAGLKVYNRLRLTEILGLLSHNAISLPFGALCFAGKGAEARWRDAKVLSLSDDSCAVRVSSLSPTELTVPHHRVIPRLGTSVIKRLLYLKRSRTSIEMKLRRLRTGDYGAGHRVLESTLGVLRNYISTVFPFTLGQATVDVSPEPTPLSELPSSRIDRRIHCVSRFNGHQVAFDTLREGLREINFSEPQVRPVALFCTQHSRQGLEGLVESLNSPREQVGGFEGMPKHFGIRLEPLPEGPYVVRSVEEYIGRARELALSPDPLRRESLALIALSPEDETYENAVPLYYRLKALLARSGHPSQVVGRETLTNKYARWNLALNTAAKLGRIPWTLEDRSSLQPVDLFMGFSYSSIRAERLGQSRNIAYVNVFDGAGTWQVFYADGSVFSFEDRLKVFPRIASEAVRSATDDPRSLGLIEVHYNKRFSRRERQAVAAGIHEQAPQASILFVSVSDDHPVRFFDSADPQMACPRGTIISPGKDTAYLQTIDADSRSGLPRPLRLHVYREFSDVKENPRAVCERVLGLTRLNWRSVRDYSSLPVTVLYSSLVAKFTGYFGLTEWKEIDHNLKRTPWFL